ncbi:MAG: UDP-N-acetylmuramate dehydrogenase [Thiotrichales bacterium]|nr:UDP-N-acetylmuramate dehydrogenase [Thiotrichales bacterium]
MHIQANYSLLNHNSFHVDIKSHYYVEVNKQSDILTLRTDFKLASLPWRVIGDGSNLLFTKDFPGLTLRCTFNKIRLVKEDDENVWLTVGAGVKWHDLVLYTVRQNWWGLENLALIPGSVGAAPVQNIGAYGAEAQDVITRVQTLNLFDGQHREFRNSECLFGYRTSIFKQQYVNRLLVYRVTIRLRKLAHGQANLSYEPLKEALKGIEKDKITPMMVFEQVIRIRQSRIPDPCKQGNAGSFFKNPIVSAEYFQTLHEEYPGLPHHKMLDGSYKIPAAWLIEQCGLKGLSQGYAGVSEQHALVLVNLGGATGSELAELSQMVQETVNHQFGIYLEPEVIIL